MISPWWFLVGFCFFLIGLTKSGFGSGVGLMNVPLMVIAYGHIDRVNGAGAALGLMLPLLTFGDLFSVYQYRRLFSLGVVKHLLPGTLVGLLVGCGLLYLVHHQKHEDLASALIRIEVGAESILMVGLHYWRLWRGAEHKLMPEPLRSRLTGAFCAASSTLAHAAGPIVAMYLLPLKLDRQRFVGTCAIYFFILNSCKLPVYAAAGQFRHASVLFSLSFLPIVLLGAFVGYGMNRRISDQLFSRLMYAATFLLGIYILILGVSQALAATRG